MKPLVWCVAGARAFLAPSLVATKRAVLPRDLFDVFGGGVGEAERSLSGHSRPQTIKPPQDPPIRTGGHCPLCRCQQPGPLFEVEVRRTRGSIAEVAAWRLPVVQGELPENRTVG